MTQTQPFMPSRTAPSRRPPARPGLRDFLTLNRLLTGQVIHLVYWAGLCVIALIAFGVIGAAAGSAFGNGLQGVLLALPLLVGGLIVAGALALLWRSFCEFYLTVFRISEDLRAIRAATEAGARPPGA